MMSSTRFTFSPMTGSSGLSTTYASALGYNSTHGDYTATATVTAGNHSETISLVQYGIPYAYLPNGGTVVNTGGTVNVNVYSHYPFRFDGVPDWITISDGLANTYSDGEVITASASTNGIVFTVDPNSASTSRSSVINFGFYRWGTSDALSASSTVTVSQDGSPEEPYFIVSPITKYIDYYSGSTGSFAVASNVEWGIDSQSNPSEFELVVADGYLNVSAKTHNQWSGSGLKSKTDSFVLTGSTSSVTRYVIQTYEPIFSGGPVSIAQSGGDFTINLETSYNWWFEGIPNYVTVTSSAGTHFEQYNSYSNTCTSTGAKTLTGTVTANNDGSARNALIRLGFRMFDGSTATTYQYITIYQPADENDIFLVVNPSALTFTSAATAGSTTMGMTVSANTSWSASWRDMTGVFSFPYGNTGTTGVWNFYVRYATAVSGTASDAILFFNDGPTVTVPVRKLSDILYINPNGDDYPITFSPWAQTGIDSLTTDVVSSTPWTATTNNNNFIISPTTGDAGTTSVTVRANCAYDPGTKYETVLTVTNANETVRTKTIRKCTVPQLSGYTNGTVQYYADGNVIDIDVHTDVYYTYINFHSPTLSYSVTTDNGEVTSISSTQQQWVSHNVADNTLHLTIQPGEGYVSVSCVFGTDEGSAYVDGATIMVFQYDDLPEEDPDE